MARIGVLPSLWRENRPFVAVEVMIRGIPAISSDRSKVPEALGYAGIVLVIRPRLTQATRE